MKIAVTGGPGQLVLSLLELGRGLGDDVVSLGPPILDLARRDDCAVHDALARVAPDVIVNAAAFTAVDKAESEPELSEAINADGAGAVARAAASLGLPLVHVSTDYVFAGDAPRPYRETDETGPTGVYGRTKLAGEQAVLSSTRNVAILRTAWVYSPFGNNFVKTMLRLAEDRDEIGVVDDQHGNPTSALDLGAVVLEVARRLRADDAADLRGVFHAAGTGDATWAELAAHVFESSAAVGGPVARVRRITTSDYPTPARRPANSRLDCGRLAEVYGLHLPGWHDSAATVTRRLISEGTFRT